MAIEIKPVPLDLDGLATVAMNKLSLLSSSLGYVTRGGADNTHREDLRYACKIKDEDVRDRFAAMSELLYKQGCKLHGARELTDELRKLIQEIKSLAKKETGEEIS